LPKVQQLLQRADFRIDSHVSELHIDPDPKAA
jgi:hypothetical protein